MPLDGCLESTEAEIRAPTQLPFEPVRGRQRRPLVPVDVGHPWHRECHRLIVPLGRSPVDDRAARIVEPEQGRHLVERLAGRIVPRATDEAILALDRNVIQARVSTRDHQDDGGEWYGAVLDHQLLDVPGQVMDRNQRHIKRGRDRLPECHADQERPDEPGALGHGDGITVGPLDLRLA